MPDPKKQNEKADDKKHSASENKSDDRKSQGGTHEQHVKAGQQSHKNDK